MKNENIIDNSVTSPSPILENDNGIKAQLVTDEEAEEMALDRTNTYTVTSKESVEELDKIIEAKLKETNSSFYSIEYEESNTDDEYRAIVIEYNK